ncbi:MAG: TadE/TadG family type IV pilus assembly protein [Novosphingobium sp.]
MNVTGRLKALLRNASGVAMTEFALGAPFLMFAGLYGVEQANFVLVNMKINQIASHIADNASRVGDTSQLKNRKVYESDIDDLLIGANIHGGASIDLYAHGRVIISSLEVWNQSVHAATHATTHADGVQFISWQRCLGAKKIGSFYGTQNAAMPSGMGPKGGEITAETDNPVIFVEVTYDYQPLIAGQIIANKQIRSIAAFSVRDSRDQSQIFQRNTAAPDHVSDCTRYDTSAVLM